MLVKALRTIPVILDIDKDMAELCPNAFLINFTNPAGMVTEALLRYGKNKKVIGLCNVPINMEKAAANMLGVDHSRIRMDFVGLNHMVYGKKIFLDGSDVTNQVVDAIADGKMGAIVKNIKDFEWDADFIKSLGMMPCPYHKYYYETQEMLESELKEFAKGETRAEVVKRLEDDLFKLYDDPNLDIKPPQLEKRGGALYSDAACRLINSIYNDKGDIQPVDCRNNGAIEGLDDDSAVEVSCVITKEGPRPLAMGKLPLQITGLVQEIKTFEKLVIEAAVTGDYHTALMAMSMNPLVPSDKMAKILLDELLVAHKDYLPQFKDEIAKIESAK